MIGSPRPEPDHELDVLDIMLVVLTPMKHLVSDFGHNSPVTPKQHR